VELPNIKLHGHPFKGSGVAAYGEKDGQTFLSELAKVYTWDRTSRGVGWLVYSCCSHLEHNRASVKRFVSLQFLNVRHSVGRLRRVISSSQGRYLTQTQNKHIHASSWIPTHNPSFRANEDSSCLRRCGHCDQLLHARTIHNILPVSYSTINNCN
jgi:hypothetical protein